MASARSKCDPWVSFVEEVEVEALSVPAEPSVPAELSVPSAPPVPPKLSESSGRGEDGFFRIMMMCLPRGVVD